MSVVSVSDDEDTGDYVTLSDNESSPPEKKTKTECDLGDRCFRVNKNHLKYTSHPHLDELLSSLPNQDPIELPRYFQCNISYTTLKIQLQVLKDLKNGIVPVSPVKMPRKSTYTQPGPSATPSKDCRFGSTCFRKHPEHFKEFEHPHLNRILNALGDTVPSADLLKPFNCGVSWDTVKNQLEILRKIKGLPTPKLASNSESPSSSKTVEPGTSSADSNAAAAERYRVVVIDRVKNNILDKLKASAPYNLFLTTISDSPNTHNELLSLTFSELLDPNLGNLHSSLQINFMVQLGWMLAEYQVMGHRGKPLTLLYGEIDAEPIPENLNYFLKTVKIKPPSPFGSHHTKMMIFSYEDKSIRVVVSTANLVESDWDNRTQGLWISGKCPALPANSDSMAGESPTMFKMSLLRYLSSYKCPELVPWIMKVSQSDMSKIKVFFVPTIPGSHSVNRQHWGQCCLSSILSEHVDVPEKNSYPVVVQCSSIGSLGPNPESWLMGDMLRTFCSGRKSGLVSHPPLKFVYPSFHDVEKSYDGLLGGGCLPYRQATHQKQEWLTCFMYRWKSDKRHRTRAPPHIKTYCRISPDNRRLSYFLLTSANISKAAWGSVTKSGVLSCLSYEAGVLFLPQFMINSDYFPLTEDVKPHDDVPVFPLPYDLPLVTYDPGDVPWVMDHIL